MAMEIPVMITRTDGFWDDDNLINDENIILLEENNVDIWKNNIEKLEKNSKYRDLLIKNANLSLDKYFNMKRNFELFNKYF